jgi:hypothetical protein
MALRYIDGFDWFVNDEVVDNYQGRWTNVGSPTTGFVKRITDTASGTGAAMRLLASQDMVHTIEGGPLVTGYMGVRFRTGSLSSQKTVCDFIVPAGINLRLRINSSGNLEVSRNTSPILDTGTFMFSPDTWYYIEAKWFIHDSTGTFEVHVNGDPTPDIDLSGADTHWGGDTDVRSIEFQGENVTQDFDDFYIDDAQFHGDVFVETLVADGVGTDADFTPLVGANWEEVDELPTDLDTTYNESLTVDDRDRFTHTDLPADTDVVLGVQVGIFAKKTIAGPRELRTLAHDGVTEGEGAAQTPGVEWGWLYDMYEDHPTGAAEWTESEVNAGEFGYTVES